MKILLGIGFLVSLLLIYLAVKLLLRYDRAAYRRLAYAVSALWVGIPFLLIWATRRFNMSEIDPEAWVAWVLLAVIPIMLFWAFVWVIRGFRASAD